MRLHTAVVWAGDTSAQHFESLRHPMVRVDDARELLLETTREDVAAVAFIDASMLNHELLASLTCPVVALTSAAGAHVVPRTIELIATYEQLAHVVATSLLTLPLAEGYLNALVRRLAYGADVPQLNEEGVGRVALLTHAARRSHRFERMEAFFASYNVSERSIAALLEIAEELVMNALYDAPYDAGHFQSAVPRTQDVTLPPNRACEISYGFVGNRASVRVRDTFGAFTRSRLLEVLARCNAPQIALDESRGGAGLGLWRVFAAATTIAITVVPERLTDIQVNVALQDGRLATRHLQALDLFFETSLDDRALRDGSMMEGSITATSI